MTNLPASTILSLNAEQAGALTAWVHLIPAGTFTGVDGRGPYRLTDPVGVVQTTRAHHGRKKIVFDYEHQSYFARQNGKPAPAAGWIVGLEARDDGVWGLVEWTEAAAQHIAKREYRYVSPVFTHRKDGTVTMLDNAALTNSPNLDQLTALNRAETTMDGNDLTTKVREAAALLGLPDTADAAAVTARLKEVMALASDLAALTGDTTLAMSASQPDPARFVPIGDFQRTVAELNKLRSGVSQEQAERHVAEHIRSGVILPFMKEWAVSLCTTNKKAFDDFVNGCGPGFSHVLEVSHATAKGPGARSMHAAGDGLTDSELAVCRNMGLTAEEFIASRKPSAETWS